MPRFRDEAVCLRSIEWSETSQIVVLLTRERGKVRGLAKGSKRLSPSSIARFSGGIELLQRGEVLATTKATAELANVTEWDLADDHHHLRRSLRAQRLAMYAADACDAVLQELDPHPASFAAMTRFLSDLAFADGMGEALLTFQWALLVDGGFKPEVERDVHSREAMDLDGTRAGEVAFDPVQGGLTRRQGPGQWKMRRSTAVLLREIDARGGSLPDQATQDAVERANRLLCSFLRELLGRELPTMSAVLG
jgi:DNA repair protein RecO (recombination protein O)